MIAKRCDLALPARALAARALAAREAAAAA